MYADAAFSFLAPRQIALLKLLGYGAPAYAHVPLLLDAEGQRLAKEHESLALRSLRQWAQTPPHNGLLGSLRGVTRWCGSQPCRTIAAFSLLHASTDDIRIGGDALRALVA